MKLRKVINFKQNFIIHLVDERLLICHGYGYLERMRCKKNLKLCWSGMPRAGGENGSNGKSGLWNNKTNVISDPHRRKFRLQRIVAEESFFRMEDILHCTIVLNKIISIIIIVIIITNFKLILLLL